MKTMYKVVQSPEDLKDFLKETIQEMKKLQGEKKVEKTGETEETEEEEEDGEKKVKVLKIPADTGTPASLKP